MLCIHFIIYILYIYIDIYPFLPWSEFPHFQKHGLTSQARPYRERSRSRRQILIKKENRGNLKSFSKGYWYHKFSMVLVWFSMVWYGFSMVQFKGILPNLATDLGFILIYTLGLSSSLQAFPTGRRRFYGLITWAPLQQKLCSFIYVNIFICTYIYVYRTFGRVFHFMFHFVRGMAQWCLKQVVGLLLCGWVFDSDGPSPCPVLYLSKHECMITLSPDDLRYTFPHRGAWWLWS